MTNTAPLPDPTIDEVLEELRFAASLGRIGASIEVTGTGDTRIRLRGQANQNRFPGAQVHAVIELRTYAPMVTAGVIGPACAAAYIWTPDGWCRIYSGSEEMALRHEQTTAARPHG